MKKIVCIIRSSQFEKVKEALKDKGFDFFTYTEVSVSGHEKPDEFFYRGLVYDSGHIKRIKMEVIVSEMYANVAIKTIKLAAYTGELGDGFIFVSELETLVNIRTGLLNTDALNK